MPLQQLACLCPTVTQHKPPNTCLFHISILRWITLTNCFGVVPGPKEQLRGPVPEGHHHRVQVRQGLQGRVEESGKPHVSCVVFTEKTRCAEQTKELCDSDMSEVCCDSHMWHSSKALYKCFRHTNESVKRCRCPTWPLPIRRALKFRDTSLKCCTKNLLRRWTENL